jgi:chromosome segregation ATPase
MFKLVKKITVGAIVVAAGLMLLSWAGLSSYPATAFGKFRQSLKKEVPAEFEIERLKHLIAQLTPDMKKNINTVAEMKVAVDNLREDINATHARLKVKEKTLAAMAQELNSNTARVVWKGRTWDADRFQENVDSELTAYRTAEAEVKAKEKLLDAKEKELDAARQQLADVRRIKQEMETEVAQMEAELKTIRASQTRSNFQIDNSTLSQCKQTLADLKNKLKVEKTALEMRAEYGDETVPTPKTVRSKKELTKELEAFLGDKGSVVSDQSKK